jgi:hypothetical protein
MNRKLIFTLLAFVALFITSCNEDDNSPVPDLNVQILAGEWSAVLVLPGGDFYEWNLTTSNTSNNASNALLLTDLFGTTKQPTLWQFTVVVPADPWSPVFGQNEPVTNLYYDVQGQDPIVVPYDIGIIVKNGNVQPKAIKLPSGWMADKISFTIAFEDDYPAYTEYRVVGYRISGFLEDVGYVYLEE